MDLLSHYNCSKVYPIRTMKTLLKVVLNTQEPKIYINQEWTDPKKAKSIPRTVYLSSFKKQQRVSYNSEQISKDIILNPVNRAGVGGGKLKMTWEISLV